MKAKKKWKGSATTPVRLCRSSRLRLIRFAGRKVKNSRKNLRCMITPLTSAASITSPARPTVKMPRLCQLQFRL
ncbi:MAG: hypothetical protein QM701_17915 [Propionivibrio sp.]